jgi:serine/threonine-protein kinase
MIETGASISSEGRTAVEDVRDMFQENWKNRHILRMPDDARITPIANLSEDVRNALLSKKKEVNGYYGIERRHVRALPKIVNKDVVDVLHAFSTSGATYQDVFFRFVTEKDLDPDQFDMKLSRLVAQLMHSNLLVNGAGRAKGASDAIVPSLRKGDNWLQYKIIENVKCIVDTEIYRVLDRKTDMLKALKIMRDTFPHDDMREKMARRLEKEFEITGRINHPNVVKVWEHGTHRGRTYGILDWIDGPTVRSYAYRSGERPGDDVLMRLAIECVKALKAVHEAGFLHGDVHTGNFLVKEGHVCLIDFGLSRPMEIVAAHRSQYVEGGVVVYMPPEYVRSTISKKKGLWGSVGGEVYSCGVILFSLFTNTYPYKVKLYRKDYMKSVLRDPPRSFEECGRPSWPALEEVLGQALAKERKDRFETMDEFLQALESIITSDGNPGRGEGIR